MTCKAPGFYVAGIHRGGGGGLDSLDWIKCCKPRYIVPDLKKIAEDSEASLRPVADKQ
jgi:hypothetical protein